MGSGSSDVVAFCVAFAVLAVEEACFLYPVSLCSSSAGIYTYTYAAERNENCVACSQIPKDLVFHENARLSEVMEHLSTTYQMKGPGVTTTDKQGRNRTLYLPSVSSIEERTRPNLKKTLKGIASYVLLLRLLQRRPQLHTLIPILFYLILSLFSLSLLCRSFYPLLSNVLPLVRSSRSHFFSTAHRYL